MANDTAIEWTDATWNPVTGCTKVGPGCAHCYAERFAERWRGIPNHPFEQGFDIKLWPNRLSHPMLWKRPRMIFVNSMSDLFHRDVPTSYIDEIFSVMESASHHVYQTLTKRSGRMLRYLGDRYGNKPVPHHIWVGVSVEDAKRSKRIDHLRDIDSPARFISFEPLLGSVGNISLEGIAWAIVGGESGPKARPMKAAWAAEIRDIAKENHCAFFFKQWGGARPKSGGRLLDGLEWNGFPVHLVPSEIRERLHIA